MTQSRRRSMDASLSPLALLVGTDPKSFSLQECLQMISRWLFLKACQLDPVCDFSQSSRQWTNPCTFEIESFSNYFQDAWSPWFENRILAPVVQICAPLWRCWSHIGSGAWFCRILKELESTDAVTSSFPISVAAAAADHTAMAAAADHTTIIPIASCCHHKRTQSGHHHKSHRERILAPMVLLHHQNPIGRSRDWRLLEARRVRVHREINQPTSSIPQNQ